MTTIELKELMSTKDEHYPISDRYNATHGQKERVHWQNQKDHLLPWLDAQSTKGTGSFIRKEPNYDAKTMYAHLSCPECLLWIAEAAGIPDEIVMAAAEKAKTIDKVVSRAASIRRDIPWESIETALVA